MNTVKLPRDGERFLPEYTGVIRLEHMHRYLLALQLVEDQDVLDIASGEGYGANILSRLAHRVIGVDNNALAVQVSTQNYARDGLEFRLGDALQIPVRDASIDVAVSFETIEHLEAHDAMMNELRRVLRPGGKLLISSPNKAVYSDATGYANEFHLREMQTDEFEALVARNFANLRLFGQKTAGASVFAATEAEGPFVTVFDGSASPGLPGQRYDLILASDAELPVLAHSLYELPDGSFSPENFEALERQLRTIEDAKLHFEKECRSVKEMLAEERTAHTETHKALKAARSSQNDEFAALRTLYQEVGRDLAAALESKTQMEKRLQEMQAVLEGAQEASAKSREDAMAAARAEVQQAIGINVTEAASLAKRNAEVTAGARALVADANRILQDKWWRRTALVRRLSNSIRKRRGREKKKYPKAFQLETYIAAQEAPSSFPTKAPRRGAREPRIAALSTLMQPHLTVIAMGRNEAARVNDTMRHFCALFDRVIMIDHLSDDLTGARVAAYDGHADTEVVVMRGDDQGYPQSEYMTAVANALIREARSDWVFFLDFDEFLPLPTRLTFNQALVNLQEAEVVHSHWYNLNLIDAAEGTLQGAAAEVAHEVSRFVKIALNLNQIDGRRLRIEQGNHAVTFEGVTAPVIGKRAFGLFHVPIQNEAAFARKIEQGTKAYEAIDVDKRLGSHWREIRDKLDTITADHGLMREVALRYGSQLDLIVSDYSSGEARTPARPIVLDFATAPALPAATTPQTNAEHARFTLGTLEATLAAQLPAPKPEASATLEQMLGETRYAALSDPKVPVPSRQALGALDARVAALVLSSASDLEVLAPSAWYGHIPFLFALMEAQRPRRYVELGTHAGCSFFAACQHMKANGLYGEAVAIDLWEGDHQAGFYDERTFKTFKRELERRFPSHGRYIRSYFSDAVGAFDTGSIDLLHIDGLHTYDAVREDYETWLPKLTTNATVLFHDTSEYQTDFGVWQLFEEVRGQATVSFRFFHSHGLGVMAFGTPGTNPAIDLLDALNAAPVASENFFRTFGEALFQGKRMRRRDAQSAPAG